jgi:Gpi18-like mannosyltransferase
MTNSEAAILNMLMFNDSLLALYALLCIRFMVSGKPMLASFMMTLGISIKAGGLLLIPGVLGFIHQHYGPSALLMAVGIVVSF